MGNDKMYWVLDLQDYEDVEMGTLRDAKNFLLGLWENESDYDSEEEEEEMNEFFDEIENADAKELDEMLQGSGYTLFDSKEDLEEFIR